LDGNFFTNEPDYELPMHCKFFARLHMSCHAEKATVQQDSDLARGISFVFSY
jgi:hypothetical protein